MSRAAIPTARYAARLEAARSRLGEGGPSALLVGPGAELRYLAGYDAPPLERLTLLVLTRDGPAVLVVPRLELALAEAAPAVVAGLVRVAGWGETEDGMTPVLGALGEGLGAGLGRLTGALAPAADGPDVLVSDRLWATFMLRLQVALPAARLGLASVLLRELRMRKDPDEVALLRAAARAADRVVERIAAGHLVGRTEADVAREVRARLVAEGHETADFATVGSGPNSASPHHAASDRVIRPGEPIVLDIGGTLGGYASDVARTMWVTGGDPANGPDPEFLRLFGAVEEAQAAARAAVMPGVPAEAIDAKARVIITAAGYGERFIHRVGHGIGLEVHEEPYLVGGNAEPLDSGMAFSLEPGIYLEGRYGARIEDIVVCTPDGADVLNGGGRELRVVDG